MPHHKTCSTICLASALMLLAFTSGCSSTSYQPQTAAHWSGYSYRQLPDGTLQAAFEASNPRDEQRHSDFALLHAAEITAKSGMKYFVVLDRGTRKIEKRIPMSGSSRRERVTETRPNGTTYERTISVPSAAPSGFIQETWQRCTVRFTPKPSAEGLDLAANNVFEAAETIKRLKAKYRL